MILTTEILEYAKADQQAIDSFLEHWPSGLGEFTWGYRAQLSVLLGESPVYMEFAWKAQLLPRLSMVDTTLPNLVFDHTDLRQLDLHRSVLNGSKFLHVSFEYANLVEALLRGCFLEHANFRFARLDRAIMAGAYARFADFYNADFRWNNFNGTDLRDATFWGSDLVGCSFDKAQVKGAKLSACRLTVDQRKDLQARGAIVRD